MPIIEHVSFDKKYERVFAYIFANTYLVENMDEAKHKGIGSHRFVTIEGELVETSGVVTGGSIEALQSPRRSTAKLKEIEEKRSALEFEAGRDNKVGRADRSRTIAGYDSEALGLGMEMKYAEESTVKLGKELQELTNTLASQEKCAKELQADTDASSGELKTLRRA